MQLISKLARVRLGSDVWQSGDGILTSQIKVTLGESDRSSSCSFSVCDSGLLIGAKYREISVKAGGILVPSDLLGDATTAATGTAGTATATPGASAPLSANAEDSVKLIVAECQKQGITNPQQIAYILATAQHESDSFKTLEEYADGSAYEGRSDLGNTNSGDGTKYKGRGFVQLTGRTNYDKYSKITGKDLINSPETLQQDAGLSAFVLVHGMKNGSYTGAGLDEFTDASGNVDFNGARAIVNGNDRASLIAGYAQDWLKKVPQYLGSTPTPMQAATPATPNSTAPVQTPPVVEASSKGTEIIIEIAVGWNLTFRDAISFHFIHTSTETSWDASGTQITTFGGQSVRWLLTRVPVTESFQNITFKQYLEQRCKAFGLDLQMEGDGLKYEHLSQDGQTHLQTMLREARRIGFAIKEGTGKDSGRLIVEPEARPEFTNFIIDEEVLIKPARFTDKARAASSGAPGATVSAPQTGTGETKPVLDRTTGDVKQTSPESQAGTGNAPGSTGATTGATASPVGGTVKPDASATPTATPAATPSPTPAPTGAATTESKTEGPVKTTQPNGTEVVTTKVTSTKTEAGKITKTIETRTITTPPSGVPQPQTKTETVEITEAGKKTTTTISKPGQADEVSTKEEPINAEEKRLLEVSKRSASDKAAASATPQPGAGLPNQQPGAIDLADGKAQAQSISDESKRIKGYEDSCVVVMNMDTLTFVPGQIVALSKRLFPDAFATEKRIGSVEHDFAAGTTTLNFYVPQAPPSGTQLASPANVPTNPGGFVFPIPSGATTIGDGYGTRANRPPGYMHVILDVTAPGGTPCVAMADGTIDYVGFEGSAGNMMVIKYAGGYESVYMHGLDGDPFIVQSGPVKQGQPVFKVGTTGSSSGDHLHLKFTLNGSYCLLSKVGIDVLKMGLPIERYHSTCDQY